ncbi:MAG: type IV toxin-antitoxin system AbiEi family antitoxin domain-containing protein [Bacteroidetes bacterium]|nr:type IV toxin-antitoxin system AbiEi family antitoxin domain-containing protein [Bacteroidota bacterium]
MSKKRTPRLLSLMNDLPHGLLVDTAWLTARGIDYKSIHYYVEQRWIERIVRGVYRRPLPKGAISTYLPWQAIAISLQRLHGYNVHLGGKIALNIAGHSHYVMMGKSQPVHLYGDVPPWVKRLPATDRIVVRNTSLFGDSTLGIIDNHPVHPSRQWAVGIWRWPLRASSPERAILELIDELPKHISFEYVQLTLEMMRNADPELLMELLKICRSIKVKRLFFVYAEFLELDWVKDLDPDQIDFGKGPRALVPGGDFESKYQISLPKYFLNRYYEGFCF